MIYLLRFAVLVSGLIVVFTIDSTNVIAKFVFKLALGGCVASTILYVSYLTRNSEPN